MKERRRASSVSSVEQDPGTAAGTTGRGPGRGNAFLANRLAQRQDSQPLASGLRGAAERSLGISLAGVLVHQGQDAVEATQSMGVSAFAQGRDIFLGPSVDNAPSLILAHEVAHIAQQAGGSPAASARAAASPEAEADQAGAAILAGRPAVVSPVGGPQFQAFAPGHHQDVTIAGLDDAYTPGEIGGIYQSNWERDFSQAAPAVGDAVLAWRALKLSASQHGGTPDPAACATFRQRVAGVLEMGMFEATGTSMGGYGYWEHLDNPGFTYDGEFDSPFPDEDFQNDEDPADRWGDINPRLPAYIMDSKAYIKDQVVDAVDVMRGGLGLQEVGQDIDNWQGVDKPQSYDRQELRDEAANGYDRSDDHGLSISTDVIAEETENMVPAEHRPVLGRDLSEEPAWDAVAHHLGRAMHGVEDFFAHSDWVEVALQFVRGGKEVKDGKVFSGTFDASDKAEALGHKLASLAETLLEDHDLLLRAYDQGESGQQEAQSDQGIGGKVKYITDWMKGKSLTVLGEFMDILSVSQAIDQVISSGDAGYGDIITDRSFLQDLLDKGERMQEHGRKSTGRRGHARVAKDDEGTGPDFLIAKQLAVEANRRVFGDLRDIMQLQDPGLAQTWLLKQLALIDQIVDVPSAGHPLIGLVPGANS